MHEEAQERVKNSEQLQLPEATLSYSRSTPRYKLPVSMMLSQAFRHFFNWKQVQ